MSDHPVLFEAVPVLERFDGALQPLVEESPRSFPRLQGTLQGEVLTERRDPIIGAVSSQSRPLGKRPPPTSLGDPAQVCQRRHHARVDPVTGAGIPERTADPAGLYDRPQRRRVIRLRLRHPTSAQRHRRATEAEVAKSQGQCIAGKDIEVGSIGGGAGCVRQSANGGHMIVGRLETVGGQILQGRDQLPDRGRRPEGPEAVRLVDLRHHPGRADPLAPDLEVSCPTEKLDPLLDLEGNRLLGIAGGSSRRDHHPGKDAGAKPSQDGPRENAVQPP